jgi:hypothetical protein
MSAARRRSTRPAPGTFHGDEHQLRAVAAAVVAAWDGWSAGPGVPAGAGRRGPGGDRIAAGGPGRPRPGPVAGVVTAPLGGVPVPTAAPAVAAAVEQLHRAAFGVRAEPPRPLFG